MNIEDQARQRLAGERHHDRHLQDNLTERAVEEVLSNTDSSLEETARELAADTRHQAEHLSETMVERAEEELKSL
jgi:hypothetical protein